ncbi:hypothetical protein [Puniceicoccus vermicola]|uniref:Uncharacterized protein n=1 Tax=Puniceicoccus vermicola TaxID=388746 RepID=A0A7X1E400_9BACT|nr:hypothetical protein [Puniceicoccus vermicola]MBC2601473.1 hypothetical protein [Puniceicoccus vermicola]
MSNEPYSLNDTANKATKDQRLELIKHGLVPSHQVSRITEVQARQLLKNYHKKNAARKTFRAGVILLVIAVLGAGGYFGWQYWEKENGPIRSLLQKSETQSLTVHTGAWSDWLKSEKTAVFLSDLPDDLESKLSTQNQLFQGILANQPSAKEADQAKFVEIKSEFPGGDDRRIRSTGSSSVKTRGEGLTSGVRLATLRQFYSLVNQLDLETLNSRLPSLKEKAERDIASIQGRSIDGDRPRGEQSRATLTWLERSLVPYLDRFNQFLPGNKSPNALAQWTSFESNVKPQMDSQIETLTINREIVPADGVVSVTSETTVLIQATVGTREIYFLPGGDSEIKLIPES